MSKKGQEINMYLTRGNEASLQISFMSKIVSSIKRMSN